MPVCIYLRSSFIRQVETQIQDSNSSHIPTRIPMTSGIYLDFVHTLKNQGLLGAQRQELC